MIEQNVFLKKEGQGHLTKLAILFISSPQMKSTVLKHKFSEERNESKKANSLKFKKSNNFMTL